jgi:hypothetical protein
MLSTEELPRNQQLHFTIYKEGDVQQKHVHTGACFVKKKKEQGDQNEYDDDLDPNPRG